MCNLLVSFRVFRYTSRERPAGKACAPLAMAKIKSSSNQKSKMKKNTSAAVVTHALVR